KIITIGNAKHVSKNRKQRIIPIHPKVEEILMKKQQSAKSIRLRKEPTPLIPLRGGEKRMQGYVFCKRNGKPYTGDFVSKRFKKACREAGVSEDIHFHSVRHSSITQMILQGS